MNIYNCYSPVNECHTKEPEVRTGYPSDLPNTYACLEDLDRGMEPSGTPMLCSGQGDLFSCIFDSQAATQAANSQRLATLILERGRFAGTHMSSIEWRMRDMDLWPSQGILDLHRDLYAERWQYRAMHKRMSHSYRSCYESR